MGVVGLQVAHSAQRNQYGPMWKLCACHIEIYTSDVLITTEPLFLKIKLKWSWRMGGSSAGLRLRGAVKGKVSVQVVLEEGWSLRFIAPRLSIVWPFVAFYNFSINNQNENCIIKDLRLAVARWLMDGNVLGKKLAVLVRCMFSEWSLRTVWIPNFWSHVGLVRCQYFVFADLNFAFCVCAFVLCLSCGACHEPFSFSVMKRPQNIKVCAFVWFLCSNAAGIISSLTSRKFKLFSRLSDLCVHVYC